MAAEVAVSFAAETLGNLLTQKLYCMKCVEERLQQLKSRLERMQCFLNDATEKQAVDQRVREWILEFREVANDAEDAIELFNQKVENARNRNLLGRFAALPNLLYHVHKVWKDIKSIQERLEAIEKTEIFRHLNRQENSTTTSDNVGWRHRLVPGEKDKVVVGLSYDVKLLLKKTIFSEEKDLSIACIVGIGGIGKSTLAREVFNHANVADQFERRAWVCVSSEFRPREIMKELMLQLREPKEDKRRLLETMEKVDVQSLRQMLFERLQGRRYLIVLDDVWDDSWEYLRSALPIEDKRSVLLLTSRNRVIITKHTTYVHEMKLLSREESLELLFEKAIIDKTDDRRPKELEEIGRKIADMANGLPLALTMLGGLLVVKQRHSKSEWDEVLKGINSHLGISRDGVSAILEFTYHNLPPKLKSCFLCLSFFKEDTTIRAEKLVQVWIAEGLVPKDTGEENMETATIYLEELIKRNMIQVKDMSKEGRVKNCHIHDLIHQLSINKAEEEIRFEILREEGTHGSKDKPRHRAIYCSKGGRFIDSTNQNKHLHSLFFHGEGTVDDSPSYWKSFQLLRVLDFEDFGLENLPDTIGVLIGLRYLGLRNNKLHRLPRSLGRLKKLEVLDIALNYIVLVPKVIWKLKSLRHLFMSGIRCKAPLRIDMKYLQTLLNIPVAYWKPKNMSSLQKLGIELDENTDVSKFSETLDKVPNLVYLKVRGGYNQSMAPLNKLNILDHLTTLKLHGWLASLPTDSDFPPNLSFLSLVNTYLKDDPMPVLEKLMHLRYLKLQQAYTGRAMVISEDGFPSLEILCLRRLLELEDLQFGERALEKLHQLEINFCPHLESVPEAVSSMSKLQELKMVTTKEIASKLRGADSHKISSIKSVHLIGY